MDSKPVPRQHRPSDAAPGTLATWSALLVVYVVWGSTYLGIRVVVRYIPPLLGMGTRFFVAGLLLLVVLAVRYGPGVLRVPPRRALAAGAVGALLLTGGNGAVAVAEQAVPSGLAALLVSAIPLWLVCLRLLGGDRPRLATVGGTLLGFAGIAVLALPGSQPAGTAWWGVATIIGGSLSWACGSFGSQRLPVPSQPFVAATYEMLAAGAVLLVAGAATGEGGQVHLSAIPAQAWLALAYLVVFGSLAAFSAYVWLLGNAPLSLTATYAYVNPVVAVVLGALILAEPVTGPMLAGGLIVVAGVALVVSVERPGRPPRPPRAGRQRLARPDPRPAPEGVSLTGWRERLGSAPGTDVQGTRSLVRPLTRAGAARAARRADRAGRGRPSARGIRRSPPR